MQALRAAYQELLEPKAVALVEETLGRRVAAVMSDVHCDHDIAAELFILEPAPEDQLDDELR